MTVIDASTKTAAQYRLVRLFKRTTIQIMKVFVTVMTV